MVSCLNPCCNGRGSKTFSCHLCTDLHQKVLILVVMEEGQRLSVADVQEGNPRLCLNPCCNGRGSKTMVYWDYESQSDCLNPCCNGRGSKTLFFMVLRWMLLVHCLNPCCNGRGSKTTILHGATLNVTRVLILVVMEEGQRHKYVLNVLKLKYGLNPCCNGRGSKTWWLWYKVWII